MTRRRMTGDEHELRDLGLLRSRAGDPRNTARWRSVIKEAQAQGGVCWLCGIGIEPGIQDPNHPGALQVDHVVPVSRGGDPFDPGNLRVAHRLCNIKRGARRPVTGGDRSAGW
jgi:5-methylcytosine-specific restriction endonuclease McrA